jgi:catechol 2,3-dioxygenase-like lactoylglutathione lyase family enzyme
VTLPRFTHGLSEIVLIVRDVAVAAAFYERVLLLERDGDLRENWAWLWTGTPHESQRLGLHVGKLLFDDESPHPEGDRWGHVHFGLRTSLDAQAGAVDHVRRCGVTLHGPVQIERMNATSYFLYDPDGNLVELWAANDAASDIVSIEPLEPS